MENTSAKPSVRSTKHGWGWVLHGLAVLSGPVFSLWDWYLRHTWLVEWWRRQRGIPRCPECETTAYVEWTEQSGPGRYGCRGRPPHEHAWFEVRNRPPFP